MQVLVHTDHNIDGSERLDHQIEVEVMESLARFDGQVTRVDVHLSNETIARPEAHATRCALEAKVSGIEPMVVTARADSVLEALAGATEKLEKLLEHRFGRLADRDRRTSIRGPRNG